MKTKFILGTVALFFASVAMAQNNDCTFFFPSTQGTQLVKKGYDGKGNLLNTMTYVVTEVENNAGGMAVEADYVYADAAGTTYDQGDIEAFCQNGEFFMDSREMASNPTMVTTSGTEVEADDAVVNYPVVNAATQQDTVFFDDAYIQLYSKGNHKDRHNLSVYDRAFVQNEEVETPSGTYDCTKVSYKLKGKSPKDTVEGYGYEWYAPNVGVVRTEQYDANNNLQYYTVLEEVK